VAMAAPSSHVGAEQCQSPDSNFVICLGGEPRGAIQSNEDKDLQTPSTAQTLDLDIEDVQHSGPPILPTVVMRSPTVSAVIAAAATKTTKRPRSIDTTATAAAATPSSCVGATKVPKRSRDSTPTAETLRQKCSGTTPADRINLAAAVDKPVALMAVPPGSGAEENKAPSSGRCKYPIGLPPLSRGRVASAPPASCGKQAAPATAAAAPTAAATSPAAVNHQNTTASSVMVNDTGGSIQVTAAPASAFKRAPSGKSPVGLGGATLPPAPSKRACISTNSVVPVFDDDVALDRKKIKGLRTSFKVDQQPEIPLKIATTAAAAAAAAAGAAVGPQPKRESRRQHNAVARESTTVLPAWVQTAAEAPQVNAVLLSAAEKIKPASGSYFGSCPAWEIAGEKNERNTNPNVEKLDITDDEQGKNRPERRLRQRQELTTDTTTANDKTTGIESNYKNKLLFVPGWEAVLQTADVAPREFEEAETVAEILARGAYKRAKCNAEREYTLLKDDGNTINPSSGSPAFASPRSPAENDALSLQEAFNRADGSLYRQGFGMSEFAARMSIAASGLSADVAAKESFIQRAKRVMHGVGSHSSSVGALEEGGRKGKGKKERDADAKKSNKKINNLSSAASAAASKQKHGQQQEQKQRSPFAIGHAISNLVAQSLQPRGQATIRPSNRGKYERRKDGHRGGVNAHERRKREEGRNIKPPLPKPRIGGGRINKNGGGGGGGPVKSKSAVGGRGRQQRKLLQTPSEGRGTARVVAPPKIWPSLNEQFTKGTSKGGVNVNDLARGSRLSGSGLDIKLWNKLFKEQAAERGRVKSSRH